MIASKREELNIIQGFLAWADGAGYSLLSRIGQAVALEDYANRVLTECDCAIAHGPGHQSISYCIRTGNHKRHVSDMEHEWSDDDLSEQTYKNMVSGKTYRLAFGRY